MVPYRVECDFCHVFLSGNGRIGRTLREVTTSPKSARRPLSLAVLRAHVTRFEIANGVTPANWEDAFRDGSGALRDSDEYLSISGLYWLLGLESARADDAR
jgi:hypothetical protein